MNRTPSISILTPVWNGLPYLKECVESVSAQHYQNWELLISDNGSTDGTLDYLETLTDPRIRIFKQENNVGIMGNVNFLFKQAKAPVSQILCADDYFVKTTALSVIVNYWISANPEIGFARFGHIGNSEKRIINLENQALPAIVQKGQGDFWFFIFGNFPGNLSEVSVRTHLISENGNFPEDLPMAGDYAFWSHLARHVSMGIQKELLIYVRRHDKVASNYLSLNGELLAQHLSIYEKLIDELSSSYDRRQLINFFHYEVYAFHYRNAIKSAFKGRFSYLNTLMRVHSPILWPKWKQLIRCLPFALLNGSQGLTYGMASRLLSQKLKTHTI